MLSFRKRRRGAALIEFAFVGILFFGLLFGMIQFGIYLNTTNTLWNMSREGARFAAVQTAANDAAIVAHVKQYAPGIIDKNKLTVSVSYLNNGVTGARTKGGEVKVQLVYDMTGKNQVTTTGTKSGEEYKTLSNRFLNSTYVTASTMMVER